MKRLAFFALGLVLVVSVAVLLSSGAAPSQAQTGFPPLTAWQVVDLTQPLTLDMPIWPGDPAFEIEAWASYEEDYYFINRIAIGEHSGTHWGTPNTFIEGGRSADMIPVDELVVPAVVIDIRDKGMDDVDYRLTVEEVEAWEATHGEIPAGVVVILFTGWQDKWDDPQAFLGLDENEILHWPGFGADTAQFLIEQRGVVGLGTDTHGVDPGNDEEFGASFAIYDADGMVLECLAGLDEIPPTGATLVVGGWPIQGGSGSPARVFAFLPPTE
jgi:kynurenine formamidase